MTPEEYAALGFRVPRRIVTGHDAGGRSVVVSDGPVPVSQQIEQDGVAFHEVWITAPTPAPITAGFDDPTSGAISVQPPRNGTRIRINEFKPSHLGADGLQSPVHRTESIDYGVVLEGEITLILDDGNEIVGRAGDIFIQRGTDHAWANRGDRVARVAFVLVGGEFQADLLDLLPDVRDHLHHRGPRDEAITATHARES